MATLCINDYYEYILFSPFTNVNRNAFASINIKPHITVTMVLRKESI